MRAFLVLVLVLVLAACGGVDVNTTVLDASDATPVRPVRDMATSPDFATVPDLAALPDLSELPDLTPPRDLIECSPPGVGWGDNGCCLGNPFTVTAAGNLRCCIEWQVNPSPRQRCTRDAECCAGSNGRKVYCNQSIWQCDRAN